MQSKGGSKMKGSGLGASLPLILLTIPLIFICHQLAKEKGKNVSLWTVLVIKRDALKKISNLIYSRSYLTI
jgi:hypothetical protein